MATENIDKPSLRKVGTNSVQVTAPSGVFEGLSDDDAGVCRFLGIPYASAPVMQGTWRPPEQMYKSTMTRMAKVFGSRCPQTAGALFAFRETQEGMDCLYLNIWAPLMSEQKPAPVMVYIHGGGFMGGSGSECAYDGTQLANKGAIIVTFNYRLDAYGFAAHADMGANFGLQDQIFALKWIKENIASFGGNNECITVFGTGAGATSIRWLLSTPLSKGLFHRVILQSGGFEPRSDNLFPRPYNEAQDMTVRLFRKVVPSFGEDENEETQMLRMLQGLPKSRNVIDVLRSIPYNHFMDASEKLREDETAHLIPIPNSLQWTPVIDNEVFKQETMDDWPSLPMLVGCTHDESQFWFHGLQRMPNPWRVTKVVCRSFADEVYTILLGREKTGTTPADCIKELINAACFLEPCRATIRGEQSRRDIYAYHFARQSRGDVKAKRAAAHGTEIPYIFGNLDIGGPGYYDEIDAHISEQMQEA